MLSLDALKHTHSLNRKYHYHYLIMIFTDEDTKANIISESGIQDSRMSCEPLFRYSCFQYLVNEFEQGTGFVTVAPVSRYTY